MKTDETAPLRRWHCRWQQRRRGLWLSPVELLAYEVGISLLLLLPALTNAQLVIQADIYSQPQFAIRCNQLDSVMDRANRSCGELFPVFSIETVSLLFGGTFRELCNHSMYEMNLELNKMLNYLDNTCPKNSDPNLVPYRLATAIHLYYESYNRHCSPQSNLTPTRFAASVNVRCSPQRATPRPTADFTASLTTSASGQSTSTLSSPAPSTPATTTTMRSTASTPTTTAKTAAPTAALSTITEPTTTNTTPTQKTAAIASSTLTAIVPIVDTTTVYKITERSTAAPSADSEEKIAGLFRDLFIILMVLVGLLVLAFPLTIIFMAYRGRCVKVAEPQPMTSLNGSGARGAAAELQPSSRQLDCACTSLDHQQQQQQHGVQRTEYQHLDVDDAFRFADHNTPKRKTPAALPLSDGSVRIAAANRQPAALQLDCAFTALQKQERHVFRQREYQCLDVGDTRVSSPYDEYYNGINEEDHCYETLPNVDALSHEVRDELESREVHINVP